MLWGDEIGRLAWHPARRLSYFTFNPDFVKKGLDIAPLVASVKKSNIHLLPVWGEDERIYQKLPSFLSVAWSSITWPTIQMTITRTSHSL